MRFEGMDAAAKTTAAAAVPKINVEQAPAAQGQAGGVKSKPAAGADHANAGPPGEFILITHNAAESQAYDTLYQHEDEMSEKMAREAVDRANRVLSGSDRKFEITIHEKTKDVIVKVVDTKTNETVREIPPKKIVDLVVRLCEMAGILFDEKG
jgi:flagellar protein FlaG